MKSRGDPRGGDYVFTAPTVRYAEQDIYTKPTQFEGARAKIVLQLRQKPKTFEIQGETIGWRKRSTTVDTRIDPDWSNEDIEWKTTMRESTQVYGLLIKLERSL
eukprot:TRINITY_DN4800_c0_g1_i1.p2 TRINITY_DN4800_c0_g1~~TRINITY_DN4800_c0_g1_i1.p2  ORF type:complete len:104 (+),score=25.48 TRINITY_DN4800_c0_g1_i1:1471-1782(+)